MTDSQEDISNNNSSVQTLATHIREQLQTLSADGVDGAERDGVMRTICNYVSAACRDDEFVSRYLQDRQSGQPDREILYEDDSLGFCICGHVYAKEAHGKPHDHGPSWAIYGQAEGITEMTDWTIKNTAPATHEVAETLQVQAADTYNMQRGDVKLYDVGDVHSPKRDKPVKLLRIEGQNLDNIKRSRIEQI